MTSARGNRSQQGAVLVEMAMALPILTLILLCIIDLGFVVREHQLLQNAAREGAHSSSLSQNQIYFSTDPCGTLSTIKQIVVSYAAAEGITVNANNVTVDQAYQIPPQNAGDPGGIGSLVTVSYSRPILLRGAPYLPLGSIALTARSVFFNLYGSDTGTTLPPSTPTCP